MTWESLVTLAIVTAVFVALARNAAGPDIVLAGAAAALMTFHPLSDRFPSPAQVAAGFGNEGLLTVAVLFVIAAGLTETGGLSLVTDRVLGFPTSTRRAQIRLTTLVAGASAFVNNTPLVAMFVPVVKDWSRRARISASQLFIPLSYASILGGICTLIGTSTNLVVQAFLIQARKDDPSVPVMSMFTLTPIGVPVAILGIAVMVLMSRRLLPERQAPLQDLDSGREYTVEMMVPQGSPINGLTIEAAGLRHLPNLYLASVERDDEALPAVGSTQRLRSGDRLVFVGVVDSIVDLQKVRGLVPATNQVFKLNSPREDRCLVEAVISEACPLVGQSVREGRFRSRYDAAVIAVHRNGQRVAGKIGDIVLNTGDTLLLETHPQFLKYYRNSRDFLLTSALDNSAPRRHGRAWIALTILASMVTVAALEPFLGVSVLNAALLAAAAMLLTGCCSVEQARRSLDWPLLIALGSALAMGRAMETSGLAGTLAGGLVGVSGQPWVVLAEVYLLTLVFTEVVTNNAAAVLAFPIGQAAAAALGVSVLPFAVAIAVAASAGFATPLGYQTHLMVYGPGGYRFSDFLRMGLLLDAVVMAATVPLVALIIGF